MLDSFGTSLESVGLDFGTLDGRPEQTRLDSGLLMRLLDEVDYGMLVVDAQGCILHANHVARHELASQQALCQRGARLAACAASQSAAMRQAIERACLGQRVLLEMGLAGARLAIAFTPLAHSMAGAQDVALVICGKREVCQTLSLHRFAQLHTLTGAEEQVLRQVCIGGRPEAIARALGVALATVRSQIQSIRRKTGAATMSEVIKRMAALPPLVPALGLH